jgi:hypothetical protein
MAKIAWTFIFGLGCFLGVVVGWRGFIRIDHGLLARGSWGLAVPFPELALEVGHVGLVGELARVKRLREARVRAGATAKRRRAASASREADQAQW